MSKQVMGPVGYFVNVNRPGEKPNYQQVTDDCANDSDVVALFTAAPSIPAGWQPIETAPKTSKAILVYCSDRRNTYVANYGKVGGFLQADGWRHFGGGGDMTEEPTHWMPLPATPSE